MNVPAPYAQIFDVVVTVILLVGMVSGILSIGYNFQMWFQRTAKATFFMRRIPWWPWIDGMLTDDGIRSRKQYTRFIAIFFICLIVGAAILLLEVAIRQN